MNPFANPIPSSPAHNHRLLAALALTTTLVTLTACGSGGGSSAAAPDPRPTGNLTITRARVLDAELQAGHEVQVAATVTATETFRSVPIDYTLLNRADVDAELEDVRQHTLGTGLVEEVRPGTEEYESVVTIPEALRSDDGWYLVAEIDPANVVTETDEGDNLLSDDARPAVEIGGTQTDVADLVLESAEFDLDAVVLQPIEPKTAAGAIEDVEDTDFHATIVLTTTGAQTVDNVDLTATIDVPGLGARPLVVWIDQQAGYEEELRIQVEPGVPNTVHLDFKIPEGATRDAIQSHLENNGAPQFAVEIRINDRAGVAEYEAGVQRFDDERTGDDNSIRDQVVIVLPPPPPPPAPCETLDFGNRFAKNFGAGDFSVGLDLRGAASIDSRGAIASTNARIPVRLFGRSFDAARLTTSAQVTPSANSSAASEFDLDFDVLGVTLFSESATDPVFTFEQELSFTRSIDREKLIFVGPIPLKVRAVASGTLGFASEATLRSTEVGLSAAAFGSLDGLAEASVSLLVVSAGVGGSLTLIEDRFEVSATATLTPPTNGRLTGDLTLEVTNDLQGPRGRIFLFAEHPVLKFCFRFIPCGFRQKRHEFTLASFRSFRKVDVLFQKSASASVCLTAGS